MCVGGGSAHKDYQTSGCQLVYHKVDWLTRYHPCSHDLKAE